MARRSSAIYRAEMASPLDRAVSWAETAHFGGALDLRSPSRDLARRHVLLLDVVMVTVAGVALVWSLVAILLWMCWSRVKTDYGDDKKRM